MITLPAITELVPHEAPMLALDRLVDFSPGRATSQLTVRDDYPLAADGRVDALASMEFMAQTVAACLGMEAYSAGANVRVGMVIACRQMTLERAELVVGEVLLVEAWRVRGNDTSSHFEAEVRNPAGVRVASATLTLVHGDSMPS